ncbi:hypothetical protein LCGC14_2375650, partial [marine sediment metagenome]
AAEAARLAGVHYTTVTYAILTGRLKAEKFASVWLVNKASLRQYIQEVQTRKAKQEVKSRGL